MDLDKGRGELRTLHTLSFFIAQQMEFHLPQNVIPPSFDKPELFFHLYLCLIRKRSLLFPLA